LLPHERLIVAADFKDPREVLRLAQALNGTGVYLKVNSALRILGYELIRAIHDFNLKVFADLKLYDIPETLATDGLFLRDYKPELLTVVCSTGVASMQALKAQLPETEILGVTLLTSLTKGEVFGLYAAQTTDGMVSALAQFAVEAKIDGVISSAVEAEMLRKVIGEKMTINTPAIRPASLMVAGDDQNPERIMTPAKAIKAGADRIVVGRPIIRSEKPYDAVMRTVEEIATAVDQDDE
jgi:orotidine-5'-phosphate decarboxylase